MSKARRFAPLNNEHRIERTGSGKSSGLPVLKGVIFDVDGTLCLPQTYMFKQMRSALGISADVDILEHCHSLPHDMQVLALEKIRNIERSEMASQTPQPGLVTMMDYLESKSIPKAICTRNFDAPVTHLLETFLPEKKFDPIVTRAFRPPKPSPAGILHIAKSWDLLRPDGTGENVGDARGLIMVGDSIDDITAGYRAGAATVLLLSEVNAHLATHEYCDLVVSRLDELVPVLDQGFVGKDRKMDEDNTLGNKREVC